MAEPVSTPGGKQGAIRFLPVENCVDYRSFVCPLATTITAAAHTALGARLATLGKAETERLGVIYIKGNWGFLVYPPRGFPELRVSFYKETDKATEQTILAAISEALQTISTHEVEV